MPRQVHEITINREPAAVFALLTDFEGASKVLPGIKETKLLTPGPLRIGSRVRETRSVNGRDRTAEYVVVVLDPPRRFWMEVEQNGKRVGGDVSLSPSGNVPLARSAERAREGGFDLTPYSGATRLVYTLGFRLPWFVVWMAPFVSRAIEREMSGDLAAMKAHLERP